MTRLLTVPLLILLCVAGFMLTRPSPVDQPRQAGHLLGALPTATVVASPVVLPTATPTFPAGTLSAATAITAASSATTTTTSPVSTAQPSSSASTPALVPSDIGAGYGLDPTVVAALVTAADNKDTPPRGLPATRAIAPQFLHLPAVLPDRTLSVPILMYHHVSSLAPTTDLNYGLTVTDADFDAQLGYLHTHGYHTVLLPQVFAALYGRGKLPAHPIVLTFDDGYLDNYTDALPILRRHHAVAEFNIISAYPGITLGINSYMTWKQLKQLVADGMEIGSHTVDHQDLGTLSEDHIRFELRDSRNILQQRLGVVVQFLAYPAGEPFRSGTTAAQQEVLKLIPQYGYVGALLDGPLTTAVQDARQPYQLRRIRVSGGEELAAFAASLSQ